MPLIDFELIALVRRFDDLRRAERARLLVSAESASQTRITSLLGCWLIALGLGRRLEAFLVPSAQMSSR